MTVYEDIELPLEGDQYYEDMYENAEDFKNPDHFGDEDTYLNEEAILESEGELLEISIESNKILDEGIENEWEN